MARGRDKFNKYKKIILLISKFYSFFPKKTLKKLLVKNRKKTGNYGLVIRYCLLKNLAKSIGDNVSIQPDVYLFNVENLSIGNNVSIHPMTYIEAYGNIDIGNDVSIAHGTTLLSVSHGFDELEEIIKEQELIKKPLLIKDNVWIGAKATVLGGCTIESGAIIGAGAVVTKNVASNDIVAGVPAKVIKNRGNNICKK